MSNEKATHKFVERDGMPVCSECGHVRNADRQTQCRGALPVVATRGDDETVAKIIDLFEALSKATKGGKR